MDHFEYEALEPGYLGISRGELSFNAVYLDLDGHPGFIPVTVDQANRLEDWALGVDPRMIQDVLPDLAPEDRELLLTGLSTEMLGLEFDDSQLELPLPETSH